MANLTAISLYFAKTMAPDPSQGGALAPVEGALSKYMKDMDELKGKSSNV